MINAAAQAKPLKMCESCIALFLKELNPSGRRVEFAIAAIVAGRTQIHREKGTFCHAFASEIQFRQAFAFFPG
jgi:hypothetical protein